MPSFWSSDSSQVLLPQLLCCTQNAESSILCFSQPYFRCLMNGTYVLIAFYYFSTIYRKLFLLISMRTKRFLAELIDYYGACQHKAIFFVFYIFPYFTSYSTMFFSHVILNLGNCYSDNWFWNHQPDTWMQSRGWVWQSVFSSMNAWCCGFDRCICFPE